MRQPSEDLTASAEVELGRQQAVVESVLPRGLYAVRLPTGRRVVAGIESSARGALVRLKVGDQVEAEVSSRAPNRATIVGRL